jgi:hypothetical protein
MNKTTLFLSVVCFACLLQIYYLATSETCLTDTLVVEHTCPMLFDCIPMTSTEENMCQVVYHNVVHYAKRTTRISYNPDISETRLFFFSLILIIYFTIISVMYLANKYKCLSNILPPMILPLVIINYTMTCYILGAIIKYFLYC